MAVRKPVFGAVVLTLAVIAATPLLRSAHTKEAVPAQVFVVNTGDGTVSVVDIPTMKTAQTHNVGPRPYRIAITKDGKTVEKSDMSTKKERKTFTITFDGPDAMTMTDVGGKPQPVKFKRKKK